MVFPRFCLLFHISTQYFWLWMCWFQVYMQLLNSLRWHLQRPWLSFCCVQIWFDFFVTFMGKSNCHCSVYRLSNVPYTKVRPLSCTRKSFSSGRNLYLLGEICENMIYLLKEVYMLTCSIIKCSRKIGDISLFTRITLMSECFLLAVGENTIMLCHRSRRLLPSWMWLHDVQLTLSSQANCAV